MLQVLRSWYDRHFSDPQVAILALLLVFGFVVVIFAGRLLAPLLASIIIAYLLEGAVSFFERRGVRRILAVMAIFSVFLAVFLLVLFGVLPILSQQVGQLARELPSMINEMQRLLLELPQCYPQLLSEVQAQEMVQTLRAEVAAFAQKAVSLSLASVGHLVTFLVYLVIVPMMVFFLLKDKAMIVRWIGGFLPRDRGLAARVWEEVDIKIGGYVRGKFIEILIVWAASFIAFVTLGLDYAMLLSFMVGLSVIIPYIGAAVATLPVVGVAYFQWGFGDDFIYVLIVYAVIQFVDGNLLVPLLFSEVVNIHPVAILTAVIVFGGLWGLWGVFFAIPLATLIHAVIKSWPRYDMVAE